MFEKIRREILNIIEKNKNNEVTRHTKVCDAGVYMLYVDAFNDDTIIPFYIGQTNNFQNRHMQHMTDVMALNRLNRSCYKYALFADLYDGHARPCKIFSYMVNHNCSLNDLHMIVLQKVEDEQERIVVEQDYIDRLYAPFLGFNQLNSVLRYIDFTHGGDEKQYALAQEKDAKKIVEFAAFGYGRYNWYRSGSSLSETIQKKQPDQVLPSEFADILAAEKRLGEIKLRISEISHFNSWKAEDLVLSVCRETIEDYFAKRKLKSPDKKKLVGRICVFERDNDRKELTNYFNKYAERIDEDIFAILEQKHGERIRVIKNRVLENEAEKRTLEEEKEQLNNVLLGSLLPKMYQSHPLKALEEDISLAINDGDNVCYLNIESSCHRTDYVYDFYPQLTRIDYCVVRNGSTKGRTAYIHNALSNFFDREDIFYRESGPRYGPCKPYLYGDIDTHITTTMEYRNGINEWSLRDKNSEDAKAVLREIDNLIDEKTKIVFTTAGSKSAVLRCVEYPAIKNTILAKKLKRLCK